jgi:hypothetical protein
MLRAAGVAALAVAFAYAAATKFFDRERFVAVLRAGGLGAVAPAAGAAVPAVEVLAAAGLVVGTRASQRVALVAVLALLGAFSAWLVSLHRRRLKVPCRCFGSDAGTRLGPALARNAALAAVAAACLPGDAGDLPVEPSGSALLFVTGAVLALWGTYGVVLAWPALLKRLPDEATA